MRTLDRCGCGRLIVKHGSPRCRACSDKLTTTSPETPVRTMLRCACGHVIRRQGAIRCHGCVLAGENRRKAARLAAIPKAQLTDPALRFDPIAARYQWAQVAGR